jgi:hypothetical protein
MTYAKPEIVSLGMRQSRRLHEWWRTANSTTKAFDCRVFSFGTVSTNWGGHRDFRAAVGVSVYPATPFTPELF